MLGLGQAININHNVSEFSTPPLGTQSYNDFVYIVNLGV